MLDDQPSAAKGKTNKRENAESAVSGRFFPHTTQVFRHHIPTEFVLLAVVEVVILVLSFYVGLELRFGGNDWRERYGAYLPEAILFSTVMLAALIALGAYQRQSHKSTNVLAIRIAGSLLLGFAVISIIYYVAPMFFLGRGVLALSVLVSFVGILGARLVFSRILDTYDLRMRVLVLGGGETAGQIKAAERSGELDGLNIVDYMPMPGDREAGKGLTLVKTPGALTKYVSSKQVDVIVVAMDERRKGLPVDDLLECKMGGVEVIDLLTFFERFTSKIRIDLIVSQPSWLFLTEGFKVSNFRRMWKRIFDVLCVLLLLPFVSPALLASFLAVLVESRGKGPIFYTQTRVGENGKLFSLYKFRSMVNNAEYDGVARWAAKDDIRITRIGRILRKFRLDELPQLYNVLRGDMSFVGPRPERPEFVKRLSDNIPYYKERHRVKPGLSGWAQVNYHYGASEEDGLEKLQYDLYYVKNYSILLDALVLLQTSEVVLLGRGAQ